MAEIFQIPVTTTLMGKGSFEESHPLALGMLGMHGTAYANFAVSECDLLIAVGARFDDRVTGKLDEFASRAQVIHIDIDPAEVGKTVPQKCQLWVMCGRC
jgi:acetolactate synthase-1/2/3 large subunit